MMFNYTRTTHHTISLTSVQLHRRRWNCLQRHLQHTPDLVLHLLQRLSLRHHPRRHQLNVSEGFAMTPRRQTIQVLLERMLANPTVGSPCMQTVTTRYIARLCNYLTYRHSSPVTPEIITAQVVGNKDAIVLRSPQRGRGATMLPPPLPPKASSSTMPTRPLLRRPQSSSSDRWVPSSQTQELSIPRESQKHADVPHTPVDQKTQIVPSSQSHEREMRISDVLPPMSDIYKTPASPLERTSSPVSPLLPDSDEGVHPPTGYFVAGQSSPRFVQSSQSQSEHDLTSSWAEMLGTRQAALSRYALSILNSYPTLC